MLTQINGYACYTVKILQTQTPILFSNLGARARRADPGSAFGFDTI